MINWIYLWYTDKYIHTEDEGNRMRYTHKERDRDDRDKKTKR